MENYKALLSLRAHKDMLEIVTHITQDLQQPEAALKTVTDIAEGIASLSDMPKRFARVADRRPARKGIRKLKVGNYLVFFMIDEPNQIVHILGVLYERRDWRNIL